MPMLCVIHVCKIVTKSVKNDEKQVKIDQNRSIWVLSLYLLLYGYVGTKSMSKLLKIGQNR